MQHLELVLRIVTRSDRVQEICDDRGSPTLQSHRAAIQRSGDPRCVATWFASTNVKDIFLPSTEMASPLHTGPENSTHLKLVSDNHGQTFDREKGDMTPCFQPGLCSVDKPLNDTVTITSRHSRPLMCGGS